MCIWHLKHPEAPAFGNAFDAYQYKAQALVVFIQTTLIGKHDLHSNFESLSAQSRPLCSKLRDAPMCVYIRIIRLIVPLQIYDPLPGEPMARSTATDVESYRTSAPPQSSFRGV